MRPATPTPSTIASARPRHRLRELVDRVGGPNAITPAAFWVTSFQALAVHLTAGLPTDTNVLLRVAIVAVAQLVAFSVLLPVRALVVRSGRPRPVLVLAGFLAYGAIRGLVLDLGLASFGAEGISHLTFHVVAGILNSTLALVITALVVDTTREHAARLAAIAAANAALEQAREHALAEVEERNDAVVDRIQHDLTMPMHALDADAPDIAVTTLQRLATEVVRPMSQGAGRCSVTGSTLTLGDAGSLCKVQATKAADANFLLTQSSEQTITIARAGNVLAFTSAVPTTPLPNSTYAPVVTSVSVVTGNPTGITPTLAIAAGSASVCALSGATVTFLTTGNCVIEASAAQTTNLAAATMVTQTIAVGSLNQTITFTQPAQRAYGRASVAMQASASSGLPVMFTRGAGTTNSACVVSTGGVVTISAVGVCEVTASQGGDSQYAAASDISRRFDVVADVPAAPLVSSVSSGDQSATVAFSPPNYTGGSAITAYEVTAVSLGSGPTVTTSACSPSASPLVCTVTGLVNGDPYQISVAAINAGGTGPGWLAGTQVTPATAAFAVGGLTAVAGDTTLAVSWVPLAVGQLGGGTFTRYEVAYRASGASAWTTWTTALTSRTTSSTTITGLSNGSGYDVKVVAVTSANNTEIAGNTAVVTGFPAVVPSPPLAVTALAAAATDLQVSWRAPMANGGAPLIAPYFTVTITSTDAGAATPIACTFATPGDTFCSATGLTNGALYAVAVTATNRMGASGAGTTTYAVPSSDATLASLVVTGAAGPVVLSPAFTSGTTAYVAQVPNGVSSVTLTPTTTSGGATVTVDAVAVTSGQASASIPLPVGTTTITVVVTASDPRFTQATTIAVTRAAAPAPAPTPGVGDGESLAPLRPATSPVATTGGAGAPTVQVDGVTPSGVDVAPNDTRSGWDITGYGFGLSVETISATGRPVPMSDTGAMRVPHGGSVRISANGYLPGSPVSVFAIPSATSRALRPRTVVDLGVVYTNTLGELSASIDLSSEIDLGEYVLQINGYTPLMLERSVGLRMNVIAATESRTGVAQRAGFFAPRSAKLTKAGIARLQAVVAAVPRDARDVKVEVVAVSLSMGSGAENMRLAYARGQRVVRYLEANGVSGEYHVVLDTTFTVDATARALGFDGTAGSGAVHAPDGRPLTTATATFTALQPL